MSGARIHTGPFGSKSHVKTLYCTPPPPRHSLPGGHQREGSKGESKSLSSPQPCSPYQLLSGHIKIKRTNPIFLGREPCNPQGDCPQKCLLRTAGWGPAVTWQLSAQSWSLVEEEICSPGLRAPSIAHKHEKRRKACIPQLGSQLSETLPATIPRCGRSSPRGRGSAHTMAL